MTDLTGRVSAALSGLVDLIVPARCAGCARDGAQWCSDCAREFAFPRRVRRPLLQRGPPTFALGRYRGPVRRAVLRYKEDRWRGLAEPFGRAFAQGLHRLVPVAAGRWYLVPAPSRSAAARRRGGAHMTRIATHVVPALRALGWSVEMADCLTLRSGVRDSVGLAPVQRLRNLAEHIELRPPRLPPERASVVLLDDVVTTGATVVSCRQALAHARIELTFALSLTATGG